MQITNVFRTNFLMFTRFFEDRPRNLALTGVLRMSPCPVVRWRMLFFLFVTWYCFIRRKLSIFSRLKYSIFFSDPEEYGKNDSPFVKNILLQGLICRLQCAIVYFFSRSRWAKFHRVYLPKLWRENITGWMDDEHVWGDRLEAARKTFWPTYVALTGLLNVVNIYDHMPAALQARPWGWCSCKSKPVCTLGTFSPKERPFFVGWRRHTAELSSGQAARKRTITMSS